MRILLLGSGGREHAFAWKMSQSKKLSKLYIAPGNAGTASVGENVSLEIGRFDEIKNFVLEKKIDILVVGPEQPLVDGIADFFLNNPLLKNIPVIGPVKAGAILEGSKDFAKEFMYKYSIPTAKYKSFNKFRLKDGWDFLETLTAPYVLKADGLAAGKGVVILNDLSEAKAALQEMLNGQFGDASNTVVIEEFLDGIEVSVFVITDGISYKILPEAKDYKRIGEGDSGLNTGGMGAVSPVRFATKVFMSKVEETIIKPTINGLKNEKIKYKGFIFFGLIKVKDEPFVIEYNVRMGDPETEVVIPRIKSDLVDLFAHTANETLHEAEFEIEADTAATVMLVSKGYPGNYDKGKEIKNLTEEIDSLLFHAGTIQNGNSVLTNGGRVIAITSMGKNMDDALQKSYKNAELIEFEGKYYRTDIGFDLK